MSKVETDGVLTLDYAAFRKRFVTKKKKSWARPMIWMDADYPTTIDRSKSEDLAVVNVLEQARHKFRYDPTFTREERLEETRTAADYAMARGMNIVRFLMYILVMSDEGARKLLVMSGWKGELVKNRSEFPISNRPKFYDERNIKRFRGGMRKPCPGRPHNRSTCDGYVTANHDLCWHCLQMYGTSREQWPNWLIALVRDDDREYRLRAIEALYHRELVEDMPIAA